MSFGGRINFRPPVAPDPLGQLNVRRSQKRPKLLIRDCCGKGESKEKEAGERRRGDED